MKYIVTALVLVAGGLTVSGNDAGSPWSLLNRTPTPGEPASVTLFVREKSSGKGIPFRAIIKGSDGEFVDGSGRGVYDDGRFFSDEKTTVRLPVGPAGFDISRGPEFLPAKFDLEVPEETHLEVEVKLKRWISLADRGWFAGDNHVHSKHDAHSPIKTDLAYAALQGRAQGLNFITEAGSNVDYSNLNKLNTAEFRIRHCGEIRPGPFVGHFNPAGMEEPIPKELYEKLINRPLPAQALYGEVRKRGGIMIHTHALMPRHQLHWMGAAEAWSDSVTRNMADLFDVDANHTERLWFAILNLGNRIGVSGHTDAALGRRKTLSPGDNRIYCRADHIDYDLFVDAMRKDHTMATNGGPTFAFFSAGGLLPGDVARGKDQVSARLEIQSLNELESAAIYRDGIRVAAFNVSGKSGPLLLEKEIAIPADRDSWLVARVQDRKGKWCLTSPIFFESEEKDASKPDPASALLFQICNATRFAELRPAFFGHVITTVRTPEQIKSVVVTRDGQEVKRFLPAAGSQLPGDGKIPATGMWGDYAEGWIWFPSSGEPGHFQADFPVRESGWYRVVVETGAGRRINSSAMFFDKAHPLSHSLSTAQLRGRETELDLWGYGADIELNRLHPRLNKGSWWYPRDIYWRVKSKFGTSESTIGWPPEQPVERFKD